MSGMNAVRKPRTFYPIYSVIDGIRDLQELRSSHSSLLLRQPVQSLQRILDVVISNQFLH
jgi:hypothetical protein